jgi:hypothetical protein
MVGLQPHFAESSAFPEACRAYSKEAISGRLARASSKRKGSGRSSTSTGDISSPATW